MTAAGLWRQLRREARGAASAGRLVFFVACLAVGVAAVVAVAGFVASLDAAVRGEARQLLAADLAVSGRTPIPETVRAAVDALPGAARAEVRELLTVVAAPPRGDAPGPSQLVELKAVRGGYPFYGRLELMPDRPLDDLLDEASAVVQPDLLSRLGLAVGDTVRIGGAPFRIAGTVLDEPDRVAGAFSRGPRVFISLDGLARAALEQRGSLIDHRLLVRLAPASALGDVERAADAVRAVLPRDRRHRLETYAEAQPALRRSLERAERFLGLAALLSLLIGGVGTAQTVRAWLAARLDAVAVLKCLGWRPREVLVLYLGQTAALALLGSLAGILGGVALQQLAGRILADVLPVATLSPWQPAAMLRGLALGLGVALLFALPPLMAVRRVPPIRVLRRDAEPLPPSRAVRALAAAALIAGVFALAAWQAGSATLGAAFTGGLLAATGMLTVAARALMRLAATPRRRARPWLRHGLAALARPGAGTVGAVVALGLGVLALVALTIVERHLRDQLDQDLLREAPSVFLVDIQPDQWSGVEALLGDAGAARIDSVPVISARIESIDGRDLQSLLDDFEPRPSETDSGERAGQDERAGGERGRRGERRRWALVREQRLTYLETLPADNEIVAGTLWSDPERAELSLERDFARALGARLGSEIVFDVQGVPVPLVVTSLRTVDWGTFGINFFAVVEPGALDDAPQMRVAAARLPEGAEQGVQDALAAAYPNVTSIRIRDVLEKVTGVLARLARGVRLLAGLVLVAGLAILAGSIGAGAVRRGAEVALYKTLGMTRAQVAAAYAVEYALIGLAAGIVGAAGGGVLAWAVITRGMEIAWSLPPVPLAAAPPLAALLAAGAGLAASLHALRRRPIEVLRDVG